MADTDIWICEKCTWRNAKTETACTMCYSQRFDAIKDLPVQWQWAPNEAQWISYSLTGITEIENAWSKGSSYVNLTKGFFVGKRGYKIFFDRVKGEHLQVSPLGNRRKVRRIGSDDKSVFVPVVFAKDQEIKRCAICQDDFDEKSGNLVKLPKCKNCVFHKACLVPAIQLKGKCPLCTQY